jgi:cysteine synthase
MDFSIVDESMQYTDAEAFAMVRELAAKEGLFVGPSAGGNLVAVRHLIDQLDKPARIVTVLQDHGAKYVSKYCAV